MAGINAAEDTSGQAHQHLIAAGDASAILAASDDASGMLDGGNTGTGMVAAQDAVDRRH